MAPPRIAIVNVQVAVDLDKAAAGNPNAAVIVSSKGFKKVTQLKKGGGAKVNKETEQVPVEEQVTLPVLEEVEEEEEPAEEVHPKTSTPLTSVVDDPTWSIESPLTRRNSTSDVTGESTVDEGPEPEAPQARVLRSTQNKHLLSGLKFGKGKRAI